MIAFVGGDKGIMQMIRYCEEGGTSEVCRALLLRGLGEINKDDCGKVMATEKGKYGEEVDCTEDAKVRTAGAALGKYTCGGKVYLTRPSTHSPSGPR